MSQPSDNNPILGQQYHTQTKHSPKVCHFPWGPSKSFSLASLNSFCAQVFSSATTEAAALSYPAPASCFRGPLGLKTSFFKQPQSPLMSTSLFFGCCCNRHQWPLCHSSWNNGNKSSEQDFMSTTSLGLVKNKNKSFPKGLSWRPHRHTLWQMFWVHPHYLFGFTRSVRQTGCPPAVGSSDCSGQSSIESWLHETKPTEY